MAQSNLFTEAEMVLDPTEGCYALVSARLRDRGKKGNNFMKLQTSGDYMGGSFVCKRVNGYLRSIEKRGGEIVGKD